MDALSIRYNIQHVGDIVADIIEKPVDLAQGFAKGVALTYDIRELRKQRQGVLKEIGERMVQLAACDQAKLGYDETLNQLSSRLSGLDQALDGKMKERDEKVKACSCRTETDEH